MPTINDCCGESRSSLCVVETVYCQGADGPRSIPTKYTRRLSSDEHPYERDFTVGTEWQPLDCGYVKVTAALVLRNLKPVHARIPEPAIALQLSTRIIELQHRDGGMALEVAPGESIRIVTKLDSLMVRSRNGAVRARLFVVPA